MFFRFKIKEQLQINEFLKGIVSIFEIKFIMCFKNNNLRPRRKGANKLLMENGDQIQLFKWYSCKSIISLKIDIKQSFLNPKHYFFYPDLNPGQPSSPCTSSRALSSSTIPSLASLIILSIDLLSTSILSSSAHSRDLRFLCFK